MPSTYLCDTLFSVLSLQLKPLCMGFGFNECKYVANCGRFLYFYVFLSLYLIDTCHLQALTFYTVFTFILILCIPICVCVCVCMHLDSASPSKRTSVSSSHSVVDSDSAASINLNMEQNNVNFHVKKQSKYPHVPPAAEQKGKYSPVREDPWPQ